MDNANDDNGYLYQPLNVLQTVTKIKQRIGDDPDAVWVEELEEQKQESERHLIHPELLEASPLFAFGSNQDQVNQQQFYPANPFPDTGIKPLVKGQDGYVP